MRLTFCLSNFEGWAGQSCLRSKYIINLRLLFTYVLSYYFHTHQHLLLPLGKILICVWLVGTS